MLEARKVQGAPGTGGRFVLRRGQRRPRIFASNCQVHTSLTRLRNTISASANFSTPARQPARHGSSLLMGKYKAPTIRNAPPLGLLYPPASLFLPPPRLPPLSCLLPATREEQPGEPSPCTVQTNKNRFDRVHKHGGGRAFNRKSAFPRRPVYSYSYRRKRVLNIQFTAIYNRRECIFAQCSPFSIL